MGYCANTVEVDFGVPADKVPGALAAVNELLASIGLGEFSSLTDAVEESTCFQECTEDSDDGFRLGYHHDKYLTDTDNILYVLGRFATEGSYVRLLGEDDCLFGFRVVEGQLRTETGGFTWRLDPAPEQSAYARIMDVL